MITGDRRSQMQWKTKLFVAGEDANTDGRRDAAEARNASDDVGGRNEPEREPVHGRVTVVWIFLVVAHVIAVRAINPDIS